MSSCSLPWVAKRLRRALRMMQGLREAEGENSLAAEHRMLPGRPIILLVLAAVMAEAAK